MTAATEAAETTGHPGSALEVLRVFTKLGLTSFGGPISHLGFFRTEFVQRDPARGQPHIQGGL
jgi:chromate transporter